MSLNDECWKSDEHLLESKFADGCPAQVKLLKKQIERRKRLQMYKGDILDDPNNLVARAAIIQEKEMGEEVGEEVPVLQHEELMKKDKTRQVQGTGDVEKNVHERKIEMGVCNEENENSDSGADDKDDEKDASKTYKVEVEKKDDASDGSTKHRFSFDRTLTQDFLGVSCQKNLAEVSKNKLRDSKVNMNSGNLNNSSKFLENHINEESKVDNESRLKQEHVNNENDVHSQSRSEKCAAPPTIIGRMTLSLPTFRPATGCTNASDFIVRCFVARLRSGITVVKHGRSKWCKSRLRILHVHPDGKSLSWKPALGEPTSSKKPPKLDLSSCLEVRHAWSDDPANSNYTGTPILRAKCETLNAHKVGNGFESK